MIPPEELAKFEDPGLLVENHRSVTSLQQALINGPRDINMIRASLATVIRHDCWERRLDPDLGILIAFDAPCRDRAQRFREFLTTPLRKGLGSDARTVRKFIEDDPELLVLFEQALAAPPGNPSGNNQHCPVTDGVTGIVDSVNNSSRRESPTGNNVGYAVRRLTRDRPDLLDKVKAGELSANAAMVAAGFRKVRSPPEQVLHWWRRCSPDDKRKLLEELNQEGW